MDIFSKFPKPKLPKPKFPAPKLPSFPLPALPKSLALVPSLTLNRSLLSEAGKVIEGGAGFVTTTLGQIPFFGSLETSEDYDHKKYDEKHYFLIPDETANDGFAVYVMRCLPEGVPPINDLPKQRFVHLPSAHALPMLKDMVLKNLSDDIRNDPADPNFITENLGKFIDEIDKVDDKLFSGVLLVGGLVALVNPLAGAAVALKAMVPSVGLIVSKYGLKFASETATNIDVAQKIKRAEKDVAQQFKAGQSFQLFNPLLALLSQSGDVDHKLEGPQDLQFTCGDVDLTPADIRRLLGLTQQAVVTVCGEDHAQTLNQLSRLILSDLE